MMRRCTPESINERIAASSLHTVRVQKARSASRRTETARLPAASLAWCATRKDWITNPGRYRQDRTRSRVMETKGISPNNASAWLDHLARRDRDRSARCGSRSSDIDARDDMVLLTTCAGRGLQSSQYSAPSARIGGLRRTGQISTRAASGFVSHHSPTMPRRLTLDAQ